jgi:hypothetical protein
MKVRKITLLKMVIVIFILSPMFFIRTYANSDYNLEVDKNYQISWKYTKVDKSLMDQINTNFNSSLYCLKESDIEKDATIIHSIEKIVKSSDKWKVKISYKFDEDSHMKSKELKIYKNPSEIPYDWYYEINDFKLKYLPVDVDDYLNDLIELDSSYANISIEKGSFSQILITRSTDNGSIVSEITYDNSGIMDKFKLKFNDETALEYIKIEVRANTLDILPIFIIIIFVTVILILIPVSIVVFSRRNISKSKSSSYQHEKYSNEHYIQNRGYKEKEDSNIEPILIPVVKNPYLLVNEENSRAVYERYEFFEKDEIFEDYITQTKNDTLESHLTFESYCPLCGSKRAKDGKYCYYCGNKYEK